MCSSPTGDAPLLQLQAQQDNWQHEIERQHGVINYPYLCIDRIICCGKAILTATV